MTYDELVSAAKSYADRQDLEVAAFFDTFFTMVEGRINRLLKTRKQSTRAFSLTIDDQEYYPLPPDYSGMRDIQLNSDVPHAEHSSTHYEYLSPVLMNEQRNKSYGGKLYYTIIGNQIQIYPVQDAGKSIELVYYQKVPALTPEAESNWLSEDYPDIYLSGLISEIEIFVKNYEVGKGWYERMAIAISELDNSDVIERWSGVPLTIKLGGV